LTEKISIGQVKQQEGSKAAVIIAPILAFTPKGAIQMRRRTTANANPDGLYVPHRLLICDEISSGAKITHAKLAKLAGGVDSISVCLKELAAGIGSTEEDVSHFLLELEEHGFLSIGVAPAERKSVRCKECCQRMAQLALMGSASPALSSGTETRADAKNKESGVRSAPRRSKLKRQQPYQKASAYNLLVCLAYAKQCKKNGEPIANIHAFARYLPRTGEQDKRIPVALELVEEDNPHKDESSNILPFEAISCYRP
jgi:hypothetical protein